jgi:hypothetical protein
MASPCGLSLDDSFRQYYPLSFPVCVCGALLAPKSLLKIRTGWGSYFQWPFCPQRAPKLVKSDPCLFHIFSRLPLMLKAWLEKASICLYFAYKYLPAAEFDHNVLLLLHGSNMNIPSCWTSGSATLISWALTFAHAFSVHMPYNCLYKISEPSARKLQSSLNPLPKLDKYSNLPSFAFHPIEQFTCQGPSRCCFVPPSMQ